MPRASQRVEQQRTVAGVRMHDDRRLGARRGERGIRGGEQRPEQREVGERRDRNRSEQERPASHAVREPAASDHERRADRERRGRQHGRRLPVEARDALEEVVGVERAHVEQRRLADHAAEQRGEHELQVRGLQEDLGDRGA